MKSLLTAEECANVVREHIRCDAILSDAVANDHIAPKITPRGLKP